jgi:hypothetical protein
MQRLYAMVLIFMGERDGQTGRNSTFIFHPKVPDNVMEACCFGSTDKSGMRRVWRAWNGIETRVHCNPLVHQETFLLRQVVRQPGKSLRMPRWPEESQESQSQGWSDWSQSTWGDNSSW